MAFGTEDQEYRKRVLRKYGDLNGELHLVEIIRDGSLCVGISLVGNKDLTTMSIFVNALRDGYPAANSSQILVGDELLEVNGQSLHGRSHLNATPIFNSITSNKIQILLLRSKDFMDHIAVPPTQPKVTNGPQLTISSTVIPRKSFFSISLDRSNEDDSHQSTVLHKLTISNKSSETKKNSLMMQNHPGFGILSPNSTPDTANDELFTDLNKTNKHHLLPKSSSETLSTKSQQSFCDDLRSCPIFPGKVTRIDIRKDRLPLGLRIVGGIDMSLRRILVFEIFDGGAAAKDGRLKVGDEILEINGQSVHGLTHSEVVMCLRKSSLNIKLLLARDSWISDGPDNVNHVILKEKFFSCQEFALQVVKRPGKPLGFTAVSMWKDRGVLVADVIRSNNSEDQENILCGDEIVSVNGVSLENMPTQEALFLIKTLIGKISLEIHRADVGLLTRPSQCQECCSPYSASNNSLFKLDSVGEIKRSRSLIRRALPSCFTNGRK